MALGEATHNAADPVDQGLVDHVDQPLLERTLRRTFQADRDSVPVKPLPARKDGIQPFIEALPVGLGKRLTHPFADDVAVPNQPLKSRVRELVDVIGPFLNCDKAF